MNKLNVSNNSKKRSKSTTVVRFDADAFSKFSEVSKFYYVAQLPKNILVLRAYNTLVDTLDDTTFSTILYKNIGGVQIDLPGFSAMSPGDTSEATVALVHSHFTENGVIAIRFGAAVPTSGKFYTTVEYIELDKCNGELTNVPVRESLT